PENRVMDANAYGIGTSPAALSRLPFSLTWNTIRFGTATPRGGAGTALLLALPFSVALLAAPRSASAIARSLKRRASAAILFATAVLYLVLWAFSFQNIRYYVHILPVICVLGVATVFHFSRLWWSEAVGRICLVTVLIFQFPATS